jgi:sterol desaturase/sphingolipid hydroxylase (fatty acid hydroxylase superfamily)
MTYSEIFLNGFTNYWLYLKNEVLHPSWHNYFYWLLALSVVVWLLEIAFPWRKNQATFRKDFWMDGFYMFFNFFLFSLVGYNAISDVFVAMFNDFLGWWGVKNLLAIQVNLLPKWGQLFVLFIIRDFIQWNIHRLLHRTPFLWEFHKVHHSVEEMGFAAHLRYHWGETLVYRTLEYVPLAMVGYGLSDLFVVHIFTLAVGHFNHSNIKLPLGNLKYIFNSPQMHIWHHAAELPEGSYGINFGLTLSMWDYLFGTAHVPHDGRDVELGFDGVKQFPKHFFSQFVYPFRKYEVRNTKYEIRNTKYE